MMIFAINRLMYFVPEQSKRASAWCEHSIECRVGSLVSLEPVEELKTGQLLKLFSNGKFSRKKNNFKWERRQTRLPSFSGVVDFHICATDDIDCKGQSTDRVV